MPTLTALASFNGPNGADPHAGLILDAAGNLLGTTELGGANGQGAVFELARSGATYATTPVALVSFSPSASEPFGALTMDGVGNLIGTLSVGSPAVFRIATTENGYAGTFTALSSIFGGAYGPVIADAAGDLFGTVNASGTGGAGSVFEVAKTAAGYGPTTILAPFNGADGANPNSGLVADTAGNLFGSTDNGGADSHGVVFEIAKTASGYANTPIDLVSFNGVNGTSPHGLIADAAGDLFGMTTTGDSSGDGTVFEIVRSNGVYASMPTTLVNFTGANGSIPDASLIEDAAGNLFGTTSQGGANGAGTVFEIAKTLGGYANTPTILASFSSAVGENPHAGLIADATGNLYGTTYSGGANNDGTIFELTGAGFQVAGPVITNATGSQQVLTAPQAYSTVRGGGYDVLDLSHNPVATASSAYSLSANGDGTFQLSTSGSVDHVGGVLQVAFSDRTLTVAPTNSSLEYIALLYQGALDRPPDAGGLAYWIQIFSHAPAATQAMGSYGLSDASAGYNGTMSLAAGFTSSAEFMARYGSLTNQQFVTDLYANVLDRPPDPGGSNYWQSLLGSGTSREHVLVGIADSQEAITDATMGFTGQSGAHPAWLFLT